MFRPSGRTVDRHRLCPECRSGRGDDPRRIDSPLRYEGAARDVVLAAKVTGRRRALRLLADELADAVRHDVALGGTFDLVTWAPTTDRRRRRRGFDQSEIIARRVARHLGIPCRRLLRRLPGRPQTGAHRSDRLTGPRFTARPIGRRSERRVLVVDDVVTTGATLRAAAHALSISGWNDVTVAACAQTPPAGRQLASQRSPVSMRTVSIADD
jgi:predicted amidophosphoribosyltransferase